MIRRMMVMLFVLLPALSSANDKGIQLAVIFNDLVPQISAEKRAPFEWDKEAFQREIYNKLISALKDSKFLEKVEDKSLLFVTGRLTAYSKGVLSDELTYTVYFGVATRNSDPMAKKPYAIIPVTVKWSPPDPLNEILKPRIREVVDNIIKEVIQKK
ncbi:MAG: hypothetical protein QXR60_02380 [Candidatus Nanoarchaeia archaeon]